MNWDVTVMLLMLRSPARNAYSLALKLILIDSLALLSDEVYGHMACRVPCLWRGGFSSQAKSGSSLGALW